MSSAYALRSSIFLTNNSFGASLLRDAVPESRKRSLDFHVRSGDYFGTLAAVAGLMADALSSADATARDRCIKTLNELREDLAYMQDVYAVERKR